MYVMSSYKAFIVFKGSILTGTFIRLTRFDDHVYLLIEIPPKYSISEVVQKLKCIASVDLRNKFKFIKEIYLEKTGMWSDGYFVSTVGLNEEQIKKYIQNQNKYDISQDVSKEFS
jgi:putative transposase